MSKYQRTFHLPFSPEVHSDDKVLYDISNFIGKEIIISEKGDGGNSGLSYGRSPDIFPKQGVFARTHAVETDCPTFNYIKNVHYYSKLDRFNPDYMYFGENLYAVHSIEYTNLKDYFYLFGIRNEKEFLSFDDMVKEAERMDFNVVPVVFKGIMNSEKELKDFLDSEIDKESFWGGEREGFVVRNPDSFKVEDFAKNVAKYVRKGHVQTDEHWKTNWRKQNLV